MSMTLKLILTMGVSIRMTMFMSISMSYGNEIEFMNIILNLDMSISMGITNGISLRLNTVSATST